VPGHHPRRRRPPYRPLRHRPRPRRRPRLRLLLVLAGREEGAQFWLQYAAGGGQATGAICLYLLHLRRGEGRDGKYWARQIEILEHEACQYAPVPHEVVDTTPGAGGAVTVFLALRLALLKYGFPLRTAVPPPGRPSRRGRRWADC